MTQQQRRQQQQRPRWSKRSSSSHACSSCRYRTRGTRTQWGICRAASRFLAAHSTLKLTPDLFCRRHCRHDDVPQCSESAALMRKWHEGDGETRRGRFPRPASQQHTANGKPAGGAVIIDSEQIGSFRKKKTTQSERINCCVLSFFFVN